MPKALFIDGVGRKRIMSIDVERPEWLIPIPRTSFSLASIEPPPDCRISVAVFRRSPERHPTGAAIYRYERTDMR